MTEKTKKKKKSPKEMDRKELAARSARIARRMWTGFGIFVGFIILLFVLIYNGAIGYTPEIDQLKNPTDKFASTIYASGGEEMGRFYRSKSNRVYVDFDQLSPHLRNALVATEDERFDTHSGIDIKALGRSIIKRIVMGQQNAGGGSTITQQLAKQLYSPESSNIFERALQKPIEWVIAVKLERFYTKDEIIKMYFNQFDFLNNAVGIKTASFVYFGKEPATLNIQEAATLVGMCKNPAYYNPLRFKDRTRERRNVVFEQMAKAGYITEAECDSLKKLPLEVYYHKVDHNDGMAPYFREELRRVMTAKKPDPNNYSKWNRQAFVDDSIAWETNPLFGWCSKNKKPDGSNYDIYSDGLKIYTTIDARMQQYAENAVREQMMLEQKTFDSYHGKKNPYTASESMRGKLIRAAIHRTERYNVLKSQGLSEDEILNNFNTPTDLKMFSYDGDYVAHISPLDSMLIAKSYLRCSTMSMDPATGYVKCYVGGPDFRFFKYDMVSKGRRQIGSTVKPYVYSYAIHNGGLTPCSYRPGGQPAVKWYNTTWSPKGVGGTMTLKSALTSSINSVSAGFMKGTSPNWIEERGEFVFPPSELARWMHSFGITSNLEATPALSLGACEVTLQEMVAAYSAFANGGMRAMPIYVSRICDNRGNVIAEFVPQHTQVFSEDTHYKMVDMMMNVVQAGTGRCILGYLGGAQTAGKTGTTNDNSDGWFMAYTPELVTGVWVGGEERYIRNIGVGGSVAAPVYGRFMQKVYADRSLPYRTSVKFKFPEGYSACEGELGYVGYGDGGGAGGGAGDSFDASEGAFE